MMPSDRILWHLFSFNEKYRYVYKLNYSDKEAWMDWLIDMCITRTTTDLPSKVLVYVAFCSRGMFGLVSQTKVSQTY
jgi:hypothetical protein